MSLDHNASLRDADPAVAGLIDRELRRQHQHVGVIVLPRQPRDLGQPCHRRAHARVPVRRVRHPEPCPAEQHPALRLVALDASRHIVREIRIVDGSRTGGAEIERLVAERAQLLDQPRLELHAGMVRTDGNHFRHRGLMYKEYG